MLAAGVVAVLVIRRERRKRAFRGRLKRRLTRTPSVLALMAKQQQPAVVINFSLGGVAQAAQTPIEPAALAPKGARRLPSAVAQLLAGLDPRTTQRLTYGPLSSTARAAFFPQALEPAVVEGIGRLNSGGSAAAGIGRLNSGTSNAASASPAAAASALPRPPLPADAKPRKSPATGPASVPAPAAAPAPIAAAIFEIKWSDLLPDMSVKPMFGGFGVVFAARYKRVRVAVKIPRAAALSAAEPTPLNVVALLVREAQVRGAPAQRTPARSAHKNAHTQPRSLGFALTHPSARNRLTAHTRLRSLNGPPFHAFPRARSCRE